MALYHSFKFSHIVYYLFVKAESFLTLFCIFLTNGEVPFSICLWVYNILEELFSNPLLYFVLFVIKFMFFCLLILYYYSFSN